MPWVVHGDNYTESGKFLGGPAYTREGKHLKAPNITLGLIGTADVENWMSRHPTATWMLSWKF